MFARLLAAALLLWLCGAASAQQKWPSRNIEIIIPFSPGSGVDLIGRGVATALTDLLGQTAVVLNREGASGTLGFTVLAAAPPDGHMLAFGPTTSIANAPYLVKGVRYNVDSFEYICQIFENISHVLGRTAVENQFGARAFCAGAGEAGHGDLWSRRPR